MFVTGGLFFLLSQWEYGVGEGKWEGEKADPCLKVKFNFKKQTTNLTTSSFSSFLTLYSLLYMLYSSDTGTFAVAQTWCSFYQLMPLYCCSPCLGCNSSLSLPSGFFQISAKMPPSARIFSLFLLNAHICLVYSLLFSCCLLFSVRMWALCRLFFACLYIPSA